MPISSDILPAEDYHNRIAAQQQHFAQLVSRVISVNNKAMKTALRECRHPLRDPSDCAKCQNPACVEAWEAQEKLWKENDL